MSQVITHVALLVRDYDEAIEWFTTRLNFALQEDTDLGNGKRWVVVAPPGPGAALLLAKAEKPEQVARIGDQTGGRVFLFMSTADFQRDYTTMCERGVQFIEGPRQEDYGTVAVFVDLYGNKWDLVDRLR